MLWYYCIADGRSDALFRSAPDYGVQYVAMHVFHVPIIYKALYATKVYIKLYIYITVR